MTQDPRSSWRGRTATKGRKLEVGNKTKPNPCIDLFLEESNQVITFSPNPHVLNIGLVEVDETSPFSA